MRFTVGRGRWGYQPKARAGYNPSMQWFMVLFGLIGLGLLIGAGVMIARTKQFVAEAKQATATVTGYNEHQSSNDNGGSNTMYTPVLRMELPGREPIEKASGGGSTSWKPYKEGSVIRVLYDPDTPDDFRIASTGNLYMGPLIMSLIGAVFLLFAIAFTFLFGQDKSVVVSEPPAQTEE
jgi:Protein of unknown function (DUF3592)